MNGCYQVSAECCGTECVQPSRHRLVESAMSSQEFHSLDATEPVRPFVRGYLLDRLHRGDGCFSSGHRQHAYKPGYFPSGTERICRQRLLDLGHNVARCRRPHAEEIPNEGLRFVREFNE